MRRIWQALIAGTLFMASVCAAESPNFAKKSESFKVERPLSAPVVGEKLVYDVNWMGFVVGTGTLEVLEKTQVEGREVYPIVALAETNDFLSKIYRIHDTVRTYLDAENLYPVVFEKKVEEGNYRADERIRFDWKEKKGYYESFKNGSKKEFEIPGPIHDILSAFFWFRRQSPVPGRAMHTEVSSDEQTWSLEVDVLRYERKEFHKQAVPSVLIEPKTRLKGILYNRGRAWIYFSLDQNRTPIQIIFKTPFGPVVGTLRLDKS